MAAGRFIHFTQSSREAGASHVYFTMTLLGKIEQQQRQTLELHQGMKIQKWKLGRIKIAEPLSLRGTLGLEKGGERSSSSVPELSGKLHISETLARGRY